MKTSMSRLLLLLLYVGLLVAVARHNPLGGFFKPFVLFFIVYCGVVVLSQSAVAVAELADWLTRVGRRRRQSGLPVSADIWETEIEAS